MKKTLVFGSIIAVVILIITSFTSVANAQATKAHYKNSTNLQIDLLVTFMGTKDLKIQIWVR